MAITNRQHRPSHPGPHPEALRSSLEGGLQESQSDLEPSFEASASLRHLRMRVEVGSAIGEPVAVRGDMGIP